MIKKLIIVFLLFIPLTIQSLTIPQENTKTLENSSISEREIIIKQMVKQTADKYNLDAEVLFKVIKCENSEFDPNLQSRIKYSFSSEKWGVKKGDRELSYGLAMIHLPSHPEITKEQATNPEFALEFMGSEFSKGRASQWTCFRHI